MTFLALGAIFKNEAHIFQEWIEHYLSEGVEHFYLIDNGSTDDYRKILQPYIDAKQVTLFEDQTQHAQAALYNKYFQPILPTTTWFIVCDFDEFIYTTAELSTVASFLRSLNPSVGAVKIPWVMFGSSGLIDQPASVIDAFLLRQDYSTPVASNVKCIYRTTAIAGDMDIHRSDLKPDYTMIYANRQPTQNLEDTRIKLSELEIAQSEIRMNHYAVQSKSWFENVKMTRGDVNATKYDKSRNDEYFRSYDFNEVFDDALYLKHHARAEIEPFQQPMILTQLISLFNKYPIDSIACCATYLTTWSILLVVLHRYTHKHIDLLFLCTYIAICAAYVSYIHPRYYLIHIKPDDPTTTVKFVTTDSVFNMVLDACVHIAPFVFVAYYYGAYYNKRGSSLATLNAIALILSYCAITDMKKQYEINDGEQYVALAAVVSLGGLFYLARMTHST